MVLARPPATWNDRSYLRAFIEALREKQYVVIDTETTGLDSLDEVIEIAVVDATASPLFYSRIKPHRKVSEGAYRVHGISDEDLAAAPRFSQIHQRLLNATEGNLVVVYNYDFDSVKIRRTAKADRIDYQLDPFSSLCAMEAFAELYGEWNPFHQSWTWQRLSFAARRYGILHAESHTALGDARTTALLVLGMMKEAETWG